MFWYTCPPQVLFSGFGLRNPLIAVCVVCGEGTTGQVDEASPEKWWLSKDG